MFQALHRALERGMSKPQLPVPAGFPKLLKEIKARIQQAQTRAVLAANAELVRLYWDIGIAVPRESAASCGKISAVRRSATACGAIARLAPLVRPLIPSHRPDGEGQGPRGSLLVHAGNACQWLEPERSPPSFGALLVACAIEENPPHRLGRGGKEMAPTVPVLDFGHVDQPELHLVDQGRGLECLARLFLGQLGRRQLPQLVIDQGQ